MRTTMRNMHVEAVSIFHEVLEVESVLIQKVISAAEETYLGDIRNRSSNSTTVTIAKILNHPHGNCGHSVPH